jgi:hypothetical protein
VLEFPDIALEIGIRARGQVAHEIGEPIGDRVQLLLQGLFPAALAVLQQGDQQEGKHSVTWRRVLNVCGVAVCRSRVRVDVYSIRRSVRPSIASRHGDPNQVVSASRNPVSVPPPTQAMYPSGLISTAAGAATWPRAGSSQSPA